jgi:Fur family ferric uptake transcriptional regulator
VSARVTRQRGAVQAVVGELDGFHSVQDIHARLRGAGEPIGLATVYRAVAALAEDGVLDALRTDRGETLYRRCSTEHHHHHLVCRSCGRAVEVAGPTVERWADQVAREHGFADVSHTLEIVGTCAACARPPDPSVAG